MEIVRRCIGVAVPPIQAVDVAALSVARINVCNLACHHCVDVDDLGLKIQQ